jgi:S1-C subfamily serine protease
MRRVSEACLGSVGLAVLLMTGCGSSGNANGTDKAPRLPDLVARVQSGVIRIEASGCGDSGIGTGFLIGKRSVATVDHVVDGARRIVLKSGGRVVAHGQVIGADPARDLALVRTDSSLDGYRFNLAPRDPRIGDEVAVLGFPLGLPLTLSRGTVSGLNRTIPIEEVKRRRLVQTDAAVNHGNSGGPLIDVSTGDVVGLVDLGTTEANGIAFAVSAKVAEPLLRAWDTAPQPAGVSSCGSNVPPSSAAGGQAPTDEVAYVRAVDRVLRTYSAQTRADLARLIDDVMSRTIPRGAADSAISSVIAQRRDFLDAVSAVTPPSTFTRAESLLEQSLRLSISDDIVIQRWITAMYDGNTTLADSLWTQQKALSYRTSQAKETFLRAYNELRRARLGLPPLTIRY